MNEARMNNTKNCICSNCKKEFNEIILLSVGGINCDNCGSEIIPKMEYNNGGYDKEGVIWHQHSNRLLIKIMQLFPKDIPILDLGCGHAFYISALNYCGWHAKGVDMVDLGNKYVTIGDVTKPIITRPITPKNVISLEVGEHIPKEKTDGYLSNLCRNGGDIIMSWAIEGQEGVGHVNCQNNDWVIVEMHKRGYKLHGEKTAELRAAVAECHCGWFKETLMYFIPA